MINLFGSNKKKETSEPETDNKQLEQNNEESKTGESHKGFTFIHVGQQVPMSGLIEKLSELFRSFKAYEWNCYEKDSMHVFQYREGKSLKQKLGLNPTFHLLIHPASENGIYYKVQQGDWAESVEELKIADKFQISSVMGGAKEKEIGGCICDYVFSFYNITREIDFDARYIEPMTLAQQSWFYKVKNEGELLLAFLEISTMLKINGEKVAKNTDKWYFVLGTENCCAVAFDAFGDVTAVLNLIETGIIVKQEIGRDTVVAGEHKWLTTLSNDNKFFEISTASLMPRIERIRFAARKNWIEKEKDTVSNNVALSLSEELLKEKDSTFDYLSHKYITVAQENRDKPFDTITLDDDLKIILQSLFKDEQPSAHLLEWIDLWKISYPNALRLIQLILHAGISVPDQAELLNTHRDIRDAFLKKEKDAVIVLGCNIHFAKHLVACGLKEEAVALLKIMLDSLPDETLSDLLPSDDTDITDDSNGQVIRTAILDLLVDATEGEDSLKYQLQVSQLHPLSVERMGKLATESGGELHEKANLLSSILDNAIEWDAINPNNQIDQLSSLTENQLKKELPHPAGLEGGMFESMQKWLAKVPLPDYSSIKLYAERLNPQNYSAHSNIITDIKHAMGINDLEVYIARGDKSTGIECFEADPSFMIIGINHLTDGAAEFLSPGEFKHIAAAEIAHLYYKHTRITSNDVWRGAKDKGLFVLDTFLSIIPVAGFLGNSIKNFSRLSTVSSVLQKSVNLGEWADKGKSAIDYSTTAVGFIKKDKPIKDPQRVKEQEMLVTSRLMELTADRTGLLFSGDIVSSIKAIFINSAVYRPYLDVVKRYGLNDLLKKTDENGAFIYQDLTIRLSALFAFYLSDEYSKLRATINSESK